MSEQQTLSKVLIGIVKAYENEHPQGSAIYEAINIVNTAAILLSGGKTDQLQQISQACDSLL